MSGLFGNTLPIQRAPGWIGHHHGAPWNRNMSWTNPALPGIEVHHCGHQTANRPYYVVGRGFLRKFSRLADAQRAAETGIEWPEKR